MKQPAILLTVSLLCFSGALAGQEVSMGVEAGYFHPHGLDLRSIYGSGAQIGADVSIQVATDFFLLGGGRLFRKAGHLSFTRETINLSLLANCLGLGYRKPFGRRWQLFAAGGVSLNMFRESAPLAAAQKNRIGYWGQAGVSLRLLKWIAVEAKCLYQYCSMEFDYTEVDLSGLSAMVGIRFVVKD